MIKINILKQTIILACAGLVLASCVANKRPPAPQLSQVQVRTIQTREFPSETVLNGMKSVSAALQDEGYSIETANTDLGLITAIRIVDDIDSQNKSAQIFWKGTARDYRAARAWKVTANIASARDVLRVRISLVEQELNEAGGIMYSQPVTDLGPYQALFSKVDKSVFLQKNNL